jgi:hypothetical protein
MNGRKLWIAMIAALIGVAALVFLMPEAMISPGPMLKGHEAVGKNCFACHTPFLGSRAEKCVACHVVAHIGLFTTTGQPITGQRKPVAFHQQLTAQACISCHTEHQGPDATKAMQGFSHALLKPEVRAQCSSCHAKPQDSMHALVTEGCQECHSSEKWRPATFDHAKLFRLEGDHKAPCATCHVNNNFSRFTCYGCHEHSESRIRAEHEEEGIRNFVNCVECHRSGSEHGEGGERSGKDNE